MPVKQQPNAKLREMIDWQPRPTRREFLLYIGAALAAAACGDDDGGGGGRGGPPPAPVLPGDPFTIGVASGDPRAQSVILWTRLAPDPINGGGMPDIDVPVIWEVALDENFANIVATDFLFATAMFAHSVHAEAAGLAPDTWYYYRFRVGDDWTSAVGRTRTLPAEDSSPEAFRIALASCQNYKDGYYTAHGYLAEEDVDLVAFVGDYIYESGVNGAVRNHDGPELRNLEQYRNRYALYKSDPNLQAAHALAPWIMTWDDHEVNNNYAGLNLEAGNEDVTDVLALRAAAYQAYYEHLPLRIPVPDEFGHMQIYNSFVIGDLTTVYVLDGRQYRSVQACNGRIGRPCAEVDDPQRTMLGAEQKQWLIDGLRDSTTLWNTVAQQTVFTPVNFNRTFVNPDQWDGYPPERQELLNVFAEVRNVVVLTGDIHASGFASLNIDQNDATSEVIGYEVVGTSISSGGDTDVLFGLGDQAEALLANVHHLNSRRRGYVICELTRERLRAEYRIVSTVVQPDGDLITDAIFEVELATLEFTQIGTAASAGEIAEVVSVSP
jgi:alkaline phosphatase D